MSLKDKILTMFEESERNERWHTMLIYGFGVLAVISLLLAGYYGAKLTGKVFAYASDRNAEVECIKLAAEAEHRLLYSENRPGGFYITWWQAQMCQEVNIHVAAPVR